MKNKFLWTRNPDFRKIKEIDYNEYWINRGFKLNSSLKEREVIISKFVKNGSVVMDIGCGNSLLPVKLKNKKCEVFVADISTIVISEFKNIGIDGFIIDLENIKDFSVDKNFNYLILSEVLEHTKNPEEIIQKLKKNTDYFLITIPNSAFYRYRFRLFFGGRFFTQWVYHPSEHIRFWSHIDFLDWLKAMDLELIESEASNGFSFFGLIPMLKNIFKNIFGHQIVYFCKVKR